MPTDPRKRQKKLQRRAAKRKEKKHALARQQNVSLSEQLTTASKYPILDCRVTDAIEDQGIGQVVLSRELPGNRVAVGVFLVDRFCLGVKDAFGRIIPRSDYESQFGRRLRHDLPSHSVPPADGRKLIEDAVAYAQSIGLPPHPDYPRILPIFGSVNAADSTAQFEFGKDGKPFFVAGPYDTPERCRRILAILNDTCGPNGFHYLLPLSSDTFESPMADDRLLGYGEDLDEGGPDEMDEE